MAAETPPALRPNEVAELLGLARECIDIDGPAGKLAKRVCDVLVPALSRPAPAARCTGHCHCHAGADGMMHPPCCDDCTSAPASPAESATTDETARLREEVERLTLEREACWTWKCCKLSEGGKGEHALHCPRRTLEEANAGLRAALAERTRERDRLSEALRHGFPTRWKVLGELTSAAEAAESRATAAEASERDLRDRCGALAKEWDAAADVSSRRAQFGGWPESQAADGSRADALTECAEALRALALPAMKCPRTEL